MSSKMIGDESVGEYADRFFSQSSFPLFEGVEAFQELFKAGRIYPFYNLIRVTHEGIVHLFYYVTEEGKLVERDQPNLLLDPADVLMGKWGLESIVPKYPVSYT